MSTTGPSTYTRTASDHHFKCSINAIEPPYAQSKVLYVHAITGVVHRGLPRKVTREEQGLPTKQKRRKGEVVKVDRAMELLKELLS